LLCVPYRDKKVVGVFVRFRAPSSHRWRLLGPLDSSHWPLGIAVGGLSTSNLCTGSLSSGSLC
jgi:hypothetical protein